MLNVTDLRIARGDTILFDDLNFTVASGEVVLFEGPNGAGKTTLLRVLAGLYPHEQGHIDWDYPDGGTSLRDGVFFLGHQPGIKQALTVMENMRFYHGDRSTDILYQALDEMALSVSLHTRCGQLSAGQQRRVALSRLWLSRDAVWILDEPFTALDREGISKLTALFERHCEQGGVVLLSSHQPLSDGAQRIKRLRLDAQLESQA